jgi:hypothetical protein
MGRSLPAERRPPALTTLLMTTSRFDDKLRVEDEERKRKDVEANEVQLQIFSALFKHENVKYQSRSPPEQTKRWMYHYDHPVKSLKVECANKVI